MGAFLIVLLITRVTRRIAGRDARGSLIAFGIALALCTALASFGFSSENVSPLQALPWAALTYGKFALAFLVVDIYNARQLAADPSFQPTIGKQGFKLTPAWALAGAIIAIGAAVSFLLPGASLTGATVPSDNPPPPVSESTLPQSSSESAWIELTNSDIHGSIMMPGASKRETQSLAHPKGGPPIAIASYQVEYGKAFFMVQCLRLPVSAIDPSATIERVIESSRDGILKNSGARMVSERWTEYQGWPTLDVVMQATDSNETLSMNARLLLQSRRLCTLLVGNGSPTDIGYFFKSFKLDPAEDQYRLPHRGGSK